MIRKITDFEELRAYADIFNERGHPGTKNPAEWRLWFSSDDPSKPADYIRAYFCFGLVVVLQLSDPGAVVNVLVFSLTQGKLPVLCLIKKVLEKEGIKEVMFTADFKDRYKNIAKKYGLKAWKDENRWYYRKEGI